jgi:hypothetical protein
MSADEGEFHFRAVREDNLLLAHIF